MPSPAARMTNRPMLSELIEEGLYRHTCQRAGCGKMYVTGAPRHTCECQLKQGKRRSFVGQAAAFSAAQVRWIAAGRPARSDERIAEIFETLCRPCEQFKPGANPSEGLCALCGCWLRREGGLLNKIKMATEGCPTSPPLWEPEVSECNIAGTNAE